MQRSTIERAETILSRAQVVLEKDSLYPFFLHFKVKQRSGEDADVYRRYDPKTEKKLWTCTAISKDKEWTCCMKEPNEEPQCSHSLAAKKLMESI
jgi:hypothetical protein